MTAMSHPPGPGPRGGRANPSETFRDLAVAQRGSLLAWKGSMALVAALLLPSCLVTETRDIPPRNRAPLILAADVAGSITTPTDAVFLVASNPNPLLNQRGNVQEYVAKVPKACLTRILVVYSVHLW